MKKLIYISHPSGGKLENTLDIELIIRKLYSNDDIFNKYVFVSPVHNFGFMYKEYESNYYKGLQFCLDLLSYCDEMWVFDDWVNSKGCRREIEVANEEGIPTKFLGYSNNIDTVINDKLYEKEDWLKYPKALNNSLQKYKLYCCVSRDSLDKKGINNTVMSKLLYNDPFTAVVNSMKFSDSKTSNYILVEVDVITKKVLDLLDVNTSESDRMVLTETGHYRKITEAETLTEYINRNLDKFDLAINIFSKYNKSESITKANYGYKYRVLNMDCVHNINMYNCDTIDLTNFKFLIGGDVILKD